MKKILFIALFTLLYTTISAQKTPTDSMKIAFKEDNYELLKKELTKNSFTINDCFSVGEDGSYSLLSIAIKSDKNKIFDGLLTEKPELNSICYDKTALMHASKYGKLEIVKKLLEAGADKTIKNYKGRDALYYAEREGHSEIVALLK